jgi:hypothetical protein
VVAAFEPLAFSAAFQAAAPVAPDFMSQFDTLIRRVDRAAQSQLGGELVTYAPAVGAPVQVTGIFDANYVLVTGSIGNTGVEALGPAVFFRLEDLPVDPEDDEPILTIRGVDYKVLERRPDDMGGIVLAIRRAS